MLSRDQKHNLIKDQSNTKQRFAIRKLTVGVASVLLGLTFLGANSNQVNADQANQPQVVATAKKVEASTSNVQEKAVPAKALTPADTNTVKENKINGKDGNAKLTNVPDDGSVVYDYSISATDKKTGEHQEVTASDTENKVTLYGNEADDMQAHLTLTNVTDKDVFIGDSEYGKNTDPNKHNDDQATLFINAWTGPKNRVLRIDATKGAEVLFIKDGQVVNNNALPVDYLAKDGKWYHYDEFVQKFGQSAVYDVTQIGFKGIIPGKTTARMNVPLIVNTNGLINESRITIKGLNDWGKNIVVTTKFHKPEIWSMDKIANDLIHLTVRNADGSYSVIPEQNEIARELQKAGQVIQITDSGDNIDKSNQALYKGGHYKINLTTIQPILQKYGYTVNPQANDLIKPMTSYYYNTDGGLVIKGHDGQASTTHAINAGTYFYIEVHKVLDTKDASFEQGSTDAKNFKPSDWINSVTDVVKPVHVTTGYTYQDVPGDKSKVKVVSIKDAKGKTVSAINENTPAGDYFVTFGYGLNGSKDSNMQITKTIKVTVTPKAAPSVPDQPAVPTVPDDQPATPSDNVQPKPEEPAADDTDTNDTVAPKAQDDETEKTNHSSHKAAKSGKVNAAVKPAVKIAKAEAAKAKLPATGEKQTSAALIGLALASIATIVAIGASRKHN